MPNNIVENTITAIDTVIKGRLKDIRYDRTVEGIIVNTDRKTQGIYVVKYQDAEFDAYSADTSSYYKNDIVYVMIPEADWSKQKFITGRKVIASESNTDFNLRMPFDNFIGLEHLTKDNIF